jgi:membrane fusion protein (multidrug efflux system)
MSNEQRTAHEHGRSRSRLWVLMALALLVLVMAFNLAAYLLGREPEKAAVNPVPVRLAPAAQEEVKVILEQAAEVKPWQQVLIISKVKGQHIQEILVERGDWVEAGQVLARLDQTTYQAKRQEVLAKLQEAKAARAASQAKLAVLIKDKERFASLIAKKAAAQQKLDHINADHQAAEAQAKLAAAQIAAAQAALKSIDIALNDHVIRAPMSGFVSARFVDPGSLSSDKDPMFQLTDESKVKVITSVAEPDYPLARIGQRAEITVDAYPGRTFSGQVMVVSPVLNPATRSAELEVVLSNPDRSLRAGMYAQVKVVLGQRRALLVPRQAVNRAPGTGNWFVFTVDGGKARQINVEVGPAFGAKREIKKGLKPGQEVVVRGVTLLQDGMPVKLSPKGEAG